MSTVTRADLRSNPMAWWRLLKGLSGKRISQSLNQPISFKNVPFSSAKLIANKFCQQYTNVKVFKHNKESRAIFRNNKIKNPLNPNFTPFTAAFTIDAIRQTKNSTAVGPSGLAPLHLKHLGRYAIRYLTRLFTLSVRTAETPAIWRSATIIPVPKPGKPADQGKSYRPISLLCPEIKVLEKLILPSLSAALPPHPTQHGFRAGRSTISALPPLTTSIARGFNQRKPATRTGLFCGDLSSAFDVVDYDKLVDKISTTSLHPNLKRWVAAYLTDRRVRVLHQGVASSWRKQKMGVPQGSVISPLLFNFFVNDLVTSTEINVAYADDNHAAASSSDIHVVADQLSAAANEMATRAAEVGMSLSAPKSTATLFTPWTAQFNRLPPILVGGVPAEATRHPKLLGVTFDPSLTFSAHAAGMARKARGRIKLLSALANSEWGKDKECLVATFRAFIRPILDYRAPIVFPNLSPSSIHRLQLVQNRCLRLCTGCHSATAVSHLHSEAEVLPVEEHLHLLSDQYLARALQPQHINHADVSTDSGPRRMKETLRSKCYHTIEQFVGASGVVAAADYRRTIVDIHTKVVGDTISNYPPNRVLGAAVPSTGINTEELSLPRITRVTLSRLRSGFCSYLADFQHRIGASPSDSCPECQSSSHTVTHLFSCPAHPTSLSPSDLWGRPWNVAEFIRGLPQFAALPDPGDRPSPRRRAGIRPPPRPPDDSP